MKFFEDLEGDYSYKNAFCSLGNFYQNSDKMCLKSTRFNSLEDGTFFNNENGMPYNPCVQCEPEYCVKQDSENFCQREEEYSRKDFEGLKTENPINLNFLQTADIPSTQTPQSPMWQLEDYFVI